jgi:hypothetical protein
MENIHIFVKKEIDGNREFFYSWIFLRKYTIPIGVVYMLIGF